MPWAWSGPAAGGERLFAPEARDRAGRSHVTDTARYLLASTSEVYGEPLVHPQPESYLGNVSTTGPRACYDESKRFAEAAVSTYARSFDVDTAIVRIFNTYGPRMRINDGRVVSNFIVQALLGHPLTVQGDGSQTRSFCFVEDQARGLAAMLDSSEQGPINIGNPCEMTVLQLAQRVLDLSGLGRHDRVPTAPPGRPDAAPADIGERPPEARDRAGRPRSRGPEPI